MQLLLLGTGLVCVAAIAACTGDDAVVVSGTPTGASAGSVIAEGDFEKTGCFGWSTNEATLALDPDKHGGSSACRVCASGSTSVWGIFRTLPNVAPGGYQGRAFLQASGNAGPPLVVMRLQAVADGVDVGPQHDGNADLLQGVPYAQVATEITIEAGQGVAVGFLSQAPGGCFLVDDVTLVKR